MPTLNIHVIETKSDPVQAPHSLRAPTPSDASGMGRAFQGGISSPWSRSPGILDGRNHKKGTQKARKGNFKKSNRTSSQKATEEARDRRMEIEDRGP